MVKGGDPCPTFFRENSKFEEKFGVWRSLVKVVEAFSDCRIATPFNKRLGCFVKLYLNLFNKCLELLLKWELI